MSPTSPAFQLDKDAGTVVQGYGGQSLTAAAHELDLILTDGNYRWQWTAHVGFVFFDQPDHEVTVLHDDVTKLRQATADLDALIAEIRAHENAQGDSALAARLKKIEDWNQSIKEGPPE